MDSAASSSVGPPLRKANHRFTKDEWDAMRPIVEGMHPMKGINLKSIVGVIQEQKGFVVTEKQLKDKICAWNLYVNVRTGEMKAIDRIERSRREKKTGFRVRGHTFNQEKLVRWRKQQEKKSETRGSPSPVAASPAPSDISFFTVNTPSEHGSPSIASQIMHSRSGLAEFRWENIDIDGLLTMAESFEFSVPQNIPQGSAMDLARSNTGFLCREENEARARIENLQRIPGLRNEEYIDALEELYFILCDQGRYGQAARILRRSLLACREYLGENHSKTYHTISLVAECLKNQGSISSAWNLSRIVWERASIALPQSHLLFLEICLVYAENLRRTSKHKEAKLVLSQAIHTGGTWLESDHVFMLSSMQVLASVLQEEGKFAESEKILHEVLTSTTLSQGLGSLQTLLIKNRLTTCLLNQQKVSEAEEMVREVLTEWSGTPMLDHLEYFHAQDLLANAFFRQGRFDECESTAREVIRKRVQTLGPRHPNTLISQTTLFRALIDQGRYEEAEVVGQELCVAYEEVFGVDHMNTFIFLGDTGHLYHKQGRLNEALTIFDKALGGWMRLVGAEHRGTVWCWRARERVIEDIKRQQGFHGPWEEI